MAAQQNTGPTLTNVTAMGRNVVKYGLIALVLLMVSRFLFNGFAAFWRASHPEPPPPPTVGFGKLPQLRFDAKVENEKPVSYKLETATGTIPEFGDRSKVYFMPNASASLLADQSAKGTAATYGYVFEPESFGAEIYRWSKSQPLLSNLEMNIRTKNISQTTNYLSLPELLSSNQAPSGFDAVKITKSFLSKADLLPEDIATASGEVLYLKSLGGETAPAVSQSDADFIQVDLNRNPIDGIYRMFTPGGYQGTVRAIITGALKGNDSIVDIETNYNTVDYEQVHTYPLRTPRSAWQLLQAGEGYIANKGDSQNAIIRTVTLGYYDDFEEQEYLQPIYIFENEDTGFIGYVSALDPTYIQK